MKLLGEKKHEELIKVDDKKILDGDIVYNVEKIKLEKKQTTVYTDSKQIDFYAYNDKHDGKRHMELIMTDSGELLSVSFDEVDKLIKGGTKANGILNRAF